MRKSILLVVGLICAGCSTDSETTIRPTAKSGKQPQANPQSDAVAPTATTLAVSSAPARPVVQEDAKQIRIETNVGFLQQVTNIANAIKSAQTQDEFDQISPVIHSLNLEYQRRFDYERTLLSEGKGTKNRTDLRIASQMSEAMNHLEEAVNQRTKGSVQMSDTFISSALTLATLAERAEQERNNPALAQQRRTEDQRKVEEFIKERTRRR